MLTSTCSHCLGLGWGRESSLKKTNWHYGPIRRGPKVIWPTPSHGSVRGSPMTSGLGFRIPSSQLPSPQGRPWPPHIHLATAFLPMSPGHLHSHGGQAGQQVRAGRTAGQQNHKLPIISVPQDKIPSKHSKRKSRVQVCSQELCLQQQSARDVRAVEKVQTEAPTEGTHLNRGQAAQDSRCLLLEFSSRPSGPRR